MNITCLGYCAVMNRAKSNRPHHKTRDEGEIIAIKTPTIMADATIIAIGLGNKHIDVNTILSHPGNGNNELLLVKEIESSASSAYWGANSGSPFHLQLIEANGERYWISDPTIGLHSLSQLEDISISTDWLYLDYYPWIQNEMHRWLSNFKGENVFINLGNVDPISLKYSLERIHTSGITSNLVLQISLGSTFSNNRIVHDYLPLLDNNQYKTTILTGGKYGLCIIEGSKVVKYSKSNSYKLKIVDTAGAGAAVSIKALEILIATSTYSFSTFADELANAGLTQCAINGATSKQIFY